VILCAVSSVWLPVVPHILFDFLRDEARRNEVQQKNAISQLKSYQNGILLL
jgi:hypothetical protein